MYRSKENGKLTDTDDRFFVLREDGYRGPIDQDGHAAANGTDDTTQGTARLSMCFCASGCSRHPLADPGVFVDCHCWCHDTVGLHGR